MFENFGKTISGIKNKIDKSKNDLKGYLNKNKKFFNIENNNNNETITNGSSIKKLDFNTNKSNSSKKNSSKKLTKSNEENNDQFNISIKEMKEIEIKKFIEQVISLMDDIFDKNFIKSTPEKSNENNK